jgi:PAS domain S-box-containing protein
MEQLHLGSCFEELFELTPDLVFFAKDRNFRLVASNESNVRLLGLRSKADLISKTVFDLFPPALAETMHADDVRVIEHGERIINRVELHFDGEGSLAWFATSKLPLFDADGEIIGLMGMTRKVGDAESLVHIYRELNPVVEHIRENFRTSISVEDMARRSCLSVSQFRKRFTAMFNISPLQFVIKLRIHSACRALASSDDGLLKIAEVNGFGAQSHFTRQFKKYMGMTPTAYRKQYRREK